MKPKKSSSSNSNIFQLVLHPTFQLQALPFSDPQQHRFLIPIFWSVHFVVAAALSSLSHALAFPTVPHFVLGMKNNFIFGFKVSFLPMLRYCCCFSPFPTSQHMGHTVLVKEIRAECRLEFVMLPYLSLAVCAIHIEARLLLTLPRLFARQMLVVFFLFCTKSRANEAK